MGTAAVSLCLFYAVVCCLAFSADALSCSGNHSRLVTLEDSFNITFVCDEEIFRQCLEEEGVGSICSAYMRTGGISEPLSSDWLEFSVSFNKLSLRKGYHIYIFDYCFQCGYPSIIDCTCIDCPSASQGPVCYSKETTLLMRVANFSLSASNNTPSVGDNITFNCSSALADSSDIPVTFTFHPHDGSRGGPQNFTCNNQTNPTHYGAGGTQWSTNRSHDPPHDCTLHGTRISTDSSGTFQCVATLHNGRATELAYSTKLTIAVQDSPPVIPVGLEVSRHSQVALIATMIAVVTALIAVSGVLLFMQWRLRREEPEPLTDDKRSLLEEEESKSYSSESSNRISDSTMSLSEPPGSEPSTQFPLEPSQVTIERHPTPRSTLEESSPPCPSLQPPPMPPSATGIDECVQKQQFKHTNSREDYISQSPNKGTGKHCLKSNTPPAGSAIAQQSPNLLGTGMTTPSPGQATGQLPTGMPSLEPTHSSGPPTKMPSPGPPTGMPSLEPTHSSGPPTGMPSPGPPPGMPSPGPPTGMPSLEPTHSSGPPTGMPSPHSPGPPTGMPSPHSPGPATGMPSPGPPTGMPSPGPPTGMPSPHSPGPVTGMPSPHSPGPATGMPSPGPPTGMPSPGPPTGMPSPHSPGPVTGMPSPHSLGPATGMPSPHSPGPATGMPSPETQSPELGTAHSKSPNIATGMHSLKPSPSPGLVTDLGTHSELLTLGIGMPTQEPSPLPGVDAHLQSPNLMTGAPTLDCAHPPGTDTGQPLNLATGMRPTPSPVLVDAHTYSESPDNRHDCTDRDECILPRPMSQTGRASPKPSGSLEVKSHLKRRQDTGMASHPGSVEQESPLQDSRKGEATVSFAATEPSQLEAGAMERPHFKPSEDTLSLSESGSGGGDKTSLTELDISPADSLSGSPAEHVSRHSVSQAIIIRGRGTVNLDAENRSPGGRKYFLDSPASVLTQEMY